MAPNSGFAILLRSPWWVSFAIAAVIVLLCGALLPAHLAPFAAVGALPVAVIGCIAGWRQWRAPSAARVQAVLQQAAAMPWRQFAQRLEDAWRAEGHEVQRMNGPHCDLRITRGEQTLLVAARRYKAATHGVEPLRELQAAREAADAQAALYIALGAVTDNTRPFLREHGITLWQAAELAKALRGISLAP